MFRCQYAHGDTEKRPIPRHPKYKTEACQSYHKTGYCPYGPRCHFIHNEEPHVIASLVAANNAATANGTKSITPPVAISNQSTQNYFRQLNNSNEPYMNINSLSAPVRVITDSVFSTQHCNEMSKIIGTSKSILNNLF